MCGSVRAINATRVQESCRSAERASSGKIQGSYAPQRNQDGRTGSRAIDPGLDRRNNSGTSASTRPGSKLGSADVARHREADVSVISRCAFLRRKLGRPVDNYGPSRSRAGCIASGRSRRSTTAGPRLMHPRRRRLDLAVSTAPDPGAAFQRLGRLHPLNFPIKARARRTIWPLRGAHRECAREFTRNRLTVPSIAVARRIITRAPVSLVGFHVRAPHPRPDASPDP